MNQFVKIQQEMQEKKKKRSVHEPAAQSVDNLRMGRLSVPLEELKKKEKKERYLFSLYPKERELLNELALQAGFKNQYGEGNASAFLSAIIRELGGENK
ncbi:hypothetical protein ACK4CS_01300 [Enterococcus gallinarum]|uniref:Uncharacterized protein n=1 Tax=Enterococcus gallinarum TaxID=1353 RepID=A0A376GYZ5_ENTGA|nr:hypothetical protein [Enterococcus gallinarum]MCO5478626.1 hypothetical protein [Enterococcus gallinarum]MDT2686187.1 hypothetical protein [Enterococcus gallinarum]OJG47921.1 hypothetical protein RV03_GL001504 [Enterococcus gallinarum]STD81775.1 Uncharacterised protein [Enterococcus gallinarum]STE01151.1 Uncharacterised protein [Enterococcus gallinarum]